ncbi:MAG: HYExAFE family protein [Phycisphaerales bacterium]|nr:MAG: HYExAFE family protein [Phycisphaerales bacterium]
MRRHIHYEAAFEDYIRLRAWPYISVNEQKKVIFDGARIKSFDFIVYRPGKTAWLVDIKGRKFPYDGKQGRRYWENWVTQEDLDGLREWEGVFGEGFEPVFVFVYWLTAAVNDILAPDAHVFRDRSYAFAWVSANDYAAHARRRSPKWDTVSVPSQEFRRLIRHIDEA